MEARRFALWAPRLAGLCAFVVFVGFAAPGIYWFDSQEIGAAAVRLGIGHPTGFPLFLLLGRALAWLVPFGELAFRVHLASALSGAVCIWAVARLASDLGGDSLPAALGGLGAGAVLAADMTFFRQATVTEVYAITAAGLALALHAAIRVIRGERGLGLAFAAGVGAVGLHASFRLLLVVPLVVLFLWRYLRGARWPVAALGLAVLGAGGIALYLPLRSASGHVDALDWGHPRTAAALVDHLDAGRIRRSFRSQMLSGERAVVAKHARLVAARTDADLGTLAVVAAAAGAAVLLVRRGRRGAALLLLFVAAGDVAYAVFLNPMGIEDRQTGVPLAVTLAVLAGCGIAAAARSLGRAAPYVAGVLAVACAVQPALEGLAAKFAGRESEAPRAWAELAFATAPPRALLLTRNDSLSAAGMWLTLAEPVRPDVASIARQHVWDTARSRAVLGGGPAPSDVAGLIRLGRPVVWEMADEGPPVPWAPGVPVGWIGAPGLPLDVQVANAQRAFAWPAVSDQGGVEHAATAFRNLGVLASRARSFVLAVSLTEYSLELADDPIARLNLARYLLALGEVPRARGLAERALRDLPQRADVWSLLGVLDARAGRCAEARARLSHALALDPFDHDATVNLARIALCK